MLEPYTPGAPTKGLGPRRAKWRKKRTRRLKRKRRKTRARSSESALRSTAAGCSRKDQFDDAHLSACGGKFRKVVGSVNNAMSICSLRVYEPICHGKEAASDAKCPYDYQPDRNE
ncbi:uncharacterized protein EAE97_000570 [Botrytis byssoidea]|uniref:60S ribosomal protein L41 n=1 Tax=Botrytis byssoidea TaxID=139641 RepID=A0A9P5IZ68_9HELO|nr:uncharacterized protein EAE97_000570 [Botrytis byssoidea]KAF7955311.1 hypothetical protein EAE97_000570 [Botrytis byssoidea]